MQEILKSEASSLKLKIVHFPEFNAKISRWPEAIQIAVMEASTVACAFLSTWIFRFGVPLRITTDQGRQFEFHLFKEFCRLLDTKHIRTIAYHLEPNGMVEMATSTVESDN